MKRREFLLASTAGVAGTGSLGKHDRRSPKSLQPRVKTHRASFPFLPTFPAGRASSMSPPKLSFSFHQSQPHTNCFSRARYAMNLRLVRADPENRATSRCPTKPAGHCDGNLGPPARPRVPRQSRRPRRQSACHSRKLCPACQTRPRCRVRRRSPRRISRISIAPAVAD